jgi:hypothetical protein
VAAKKHGEQMCVNEDADQQARPRHVVVEEQEIGVGESGIGDQNAQTERERRGQEKEGAVVDWADDVL